MGTTKGFTTTKRMVFTMNKNKNEDFITTIKTDFTTINRNNNLTDFIMTDSTTTDFTTIMLRNRKMAFITTTDSITTEPRLMDQRKKHEESLNPERAEKSVANFFA